MTADSAELDPQGLQPHAEDVQVVLPGEADRFEQVVVVTRERVIVNAESLPDELLAEHEGRKGEREFERLRQAGVDQREGVVVEPLFPQAFSVDSGRAFQGQG